MPARCAVAGCSNTNKDGVAVHKFPKENKLKAQWTRFVKLTRADFTQPTQYQTICEDHFTSDCYDQKYRIKQTLGFSEKSKKLLPGSVPSIYPKIIKDSVTICTPPTKKRKTLTSHKRDIHRMIQHEIDPSNSSICDLDNPLLEEQTASTSSLLDISEDRTTLLQNAVKSVMVQASPKCKEKGTNYSYKPYYRSVGVQVDESEFKKILEPKCKEATDIHDIDTDTDTESEFEYNSGSSEESFDTTSDSDGESRETFTQRNFIVNEFSLLQLFKTCELCKSVSTNSRVVSSCGTSIKVVSGCDLCGHIYSWSSQPLIGSIPAANLLMSCAILFSGSMPAKSLRLFEFMNIKHISSSTFMEHQKFYLNPAVTQDWQDSQDKYINRKKTSTIVVGGDGRADTPGHSAKYGSYTMMDLDDNKIISVELIQSNEVKSSVHMEKEGLIRCVDWLKTHNIDIGTFVSDRHLQIQKWVRENLDGTDHFYDIWHVSKGLKKKMLTLSKEKDCENVSSWIKSIINHLYWSAASTEDGNGDVMWAKWESVCNHVQNIHKGHNQLFPECLHAVGLQRKWLLPGTKVCERLTDLLTTNKVKRDVKKLSPIYQTSNIEAYHSVINHFAPKMIGFSFHGMYCRLLIAAIHYNENNSREQASTRDGLLKYDVIFPKYKKGDYIVRECKKATSYGYVKRLVSYAAEKCESHNRTRIDVNVPPPLCSTYYHPRKEEAVRMKTSRFANK